MALNIKELSLEEMKAKKTALIDRQTYVFSNEPDDTKVPADIKAEIEEANHDIEALEVAIAEAAKMAGYRAQAAEQKAWMQQSAGNMRHSGAVSGEVLSADAANAAFNAHRTIGEAFMESDTYKAWHSVVHPGGMATSKDTHLQSPTIPLVDYSLKTLVTGATTATDRLTNTSGGALITPQMIDLVTLPFRPLKLREVVTVIQATSALIEYPQITGYTNNAAAVAEAGATGDTTGTKPESAFALALRTSVASTIAHWMPVTRQALSDAPQLRDLINTFLGNGLEQAVETAMVGGNGTPPNLQGLATLSGTTAQAFVTDILTTTRKAITKAQTSPVFVEPNAFVMSPGDWESIDLAFDNEHRYYYGGPSQMGTPRLWGKPVIVAQSLSNGTAYTGDLKQLVLADLQAATMYVTDSHSDWFVRNLLALLMELRLHFFCLRPAAIIKIATA